MDYEAPEDEADQVLNSEMKNFDPCYFYKFLCMNNSFGFTGHELVEAFACVVRHCMVPVVSDHGMLTFTFRMFSRTQIASEERDRLSGTQPSLPNTEILQPGNNLFFVVSYQLIFYLFTLRVLYFQLSFCLIDYYYYLCAVSSNSKRIQWTSVSCGHPFMS